MAEKIIQMPDGRVVSFPDSVSDDEIAAVLSQEESSQNTPEQPGLIARASERMGFTQNPIDQLVSEGKQLYNDPIGTMGQALKQVGQVPNSLLQMALHPVQATGGPEFAEDIQNKNYMGAAGTVIGDILPLLLGSPGVRGAVGSLPGKAKIGLQRGTVSRMGRLGPASPAYKGQPGELRPTLRSVPFGSSMLDALIPERPDVARGLFSPIPDKMPVRASAGEIISKQKPWAMPSEGEVVATQKPWGMIPEGERVAQTSPWDAGTQAVRAGTANRVPTKMPRKKSVLAPEEPLIVSPENADTFAPVTDVSIPRESLLRELRSPFLSEGRRKSILLELQRNPAGTEIPNMRYISGPYKKTYGGPIK